MVITPTQDPVTMLVLMGPLLLLYELGILLVRVVEGRRVRRAKE
jgi:sec-independent protein translocase protein TatC